MSIEATLRGNRCLDGKMVDEVLMACFRSTSDRSEMAMASDYLSALLTTEKYQRRNQILLKERVFVTFDNLLAHCRSRAYAARPDASRPRHGGRRAWSRSPAPGVWRRASSM